MSARTATPSIFGAPHESPETNSRALGSPNTGLGRGGVGKQKEALKLRLDLNLEVEIAIQAKVNGDITLSLLLFPVQILVVRIPMVHLGFCTGGAYMRKAVFVLYSQVIALFDTTLCVNLDENVRPATGV
ncbi:hypothetical protein DFS33DRAFT_1387155 [Desarmillaria ectypa]|nr:hypothetical protein DFS33DRAFT_1387155 [Desarmillaria ectypa]